MGDVVLRFVDSISSSRVVRMNLADFTIWRPQDDCRFDRLTVNRSIASTQLVDGVTYSSAKHEERILELHWWLQTASSNQAADQQQALARELNRPFNTLEYQLPNATNPIFFRTIRLAEELQFNMITDGTLYDVRATILAEPFGYGLREDPVSSVTVNFDPAAASNGGFLDIAAADVKGDVETPVKIILPSSLTGASLLAVRRRGTPSNTPFLLQAEAMTVGTDTTTQANDATMSGSSNNWTRTTFATLTTLTTRLTMTTHPASPSVDARGTYRVFGRMKKTVSGDSIQVKVTYGNSIDASGGLITLQSGTNLLMVDFGLINIPASQDPVTDMVTGTEIAAVGTTIKLAAARGGGGSGNLDVDFLLLVPADDRLALINWGGVAPPTDWALDGVSETIYGRDASARVATVAQDSTFVGGAPMLTPNQVNRVFFLYQVLPAGITAISTTTSLTLSYYPRYLSVRPTST